MRTKKVNVAALKTALKKDLKLKGYRESYLRKFSLEELKDIKKTVK